MPSLAALSNPQQQQQQQQQSESLQVPQQIGATKIVQIKTAPTIQVVPSNRPTLQNLPPLIPTQQPTFLNIQQANRQPTIQTNTSTPSSISYITNQTDAKPIGQTFQSAQQQQQQKYSPVVVQSPNVNVKGKTIILANTNTPQQKTIILRSVGADGNTILQQVPISSVSGLQNLTGNANNIVLTQGAGSNIIKTSTANQQPQFIQTTTTQQPQQQQIPALVPTSYILQQPQNQQQPQTRLVLTNSGQNQVILPQGLTLIQRWVLCDAMESISTLDLMY